jgi:hypothetical protein
VRKALIRTEKIENTSDVFAFVQSVGWLRIPANTKGMANNGFDEMEKRNSVTAGSSNVGTDLAV